MMMNRCRERAGAFAVALLMTGALTAAAGGEGRAASPQGTGSLEVTVELPPGAALDSCTLSVGEQEAVLKGEERTVLFEKLPLGRYPVTAVATVGNGAYGPGARSLGVADVTVSGITGQKAVVNVQQIDNIDEFCMSCHPDPGVPLEEGQVVRDVHVSGLALGARQVEQVEKFNRERKEFSREGTPPSPPIVLSERAGSEKNKNDKALYMTCESCHTIHRATSQESYLVAPFTQGSTLCIACHD